MKRPWALLILVLIWACIVDDVLAQQQDLTEIHSEHFAYGIPLGTDPSNDLIIRDIYALSSNDETKFADWVAYKLDKWTVFGEAKTWRKWYADPWLDEGETLEPKDYYKANEILKTDRGHQAPLGSFKGTYIFWLTNYLSNITPQNSKLNRGIWKKIEEEVRKLVGQENKVYVLTGTYYDDSLIPTLLPEADEDHRVPDGYWKILFLKPQGKYASIQTAAWYFPQADPVSSELANYLVSIDTIEDMTTLDFFWELDDADEAALESVKLTDLAFEMLDQGS